MGLKGLAIMEKGDWLGLSEAAELLGVHPSTVRSWADEGKIPVHRTAGGHRRFRRSEIERWTSTHHTVPSSEARMIVQNTIGRTRIELAEGSLQAQSWYQKLEEPDRKRYRDESRRLMQHVIRHVGPETEESEEEALQVGKEYARIGMEVGLSLRETVQAFLFFREFLMDSVFNLYETAGVRSAPAWGDIRRHMASFTDRVLLSLIDTYSRESQEQ